MVNESAIEFLTGLQGLCDTMIEGAVYLITHPEEKRVQLDIEAGLSSLRKHMNGLCTAADNLWPKFEVLFAADSLNINMLIELLKQLSNVSAESVSKALSDAIKDDIYISRPAAEKIFNYCSQIPHTNAAVYQLLFDTCAKCSLSAPMEAFENTLKVFEELPDVLSGKGNAHPGYTYRPSEQRTFEKCPICGGEGIPYYRSFSYFMADFQYPYLPVKLWMKCNGCKNLYTWKHPEAFLARSKHQEIIQPDPNSYLTALGSSNGYALSIWSNILNKLSTYSSQKTLLEIGIGKGELLAVALEMGYNADAVEISTECAQNIANILNIPIWNGDFLNYAANKSYSIIIMGDVIEHVLNPKQALQNAFRLLDDNGVLWLSTPNFESSFSRMRKYSDPMWLEPGHISYFCYRGLEKLIHDCGFEVKEYVVSNRYNGSMELILMKQHPLMEELS